MLTTNSLPSTGLRVSQAPFSASNTKNRPSQTIEVTVRPWDDDLPEPLGAESSRLNAHDRRWIQSVSRGLGHRTFVISAKQGEQVVGVLPLTLVTGIFGRFLVSLPYVNTGGVWTSCDVVSSRLIDKACWLADDLNVDYVELRHEIPIQHSQFNFERNDKVHMRLRLPGTAAELLGNFKSKLRNQIKRSQQFGLTCEFGQLQRLRDFYKVFAVNMRDLGTPVYSIDLFRQIVVAFAGDAEFCVVRDQGKPVAAALLVHNNQLTEVPSASCLRSANKKNANMFMYWNLLGQAIHRKSDVFDFGRSSRESGTYRFKKQWGCNEIPTTWQYYVRQGDPSQMKADAGSKKKLVECWKRLPVWFTKLIGPKIVRGIP